MRFVDHKSLVLALVFAASCTNAQPLAEINEVVEQTEASEFASCNSANQLRRECYRSAIAQFNHEIIIYYASGITGANDVFVPDAVNVLRGIVERCALGRTVLSYHTDGVASLYVGKGGLSAAQIGCIRQFERPGLFLQNDRTN